MVVALGTVIIITILSLIFYKQIHKYKYILYIVAFASGIIVHEQANFITYGYIPLGFFIVVMFSGVLNKGLVRKRLFMVRAEIAIIGTLLLFPHVLAFTEFVIDEYGLFGAPTNFYFGILAVIIILPLFITSFRNIRKLISYKQWKKLHQYAYPLYLAIAFHLILINNERQQIYIVIFSTYGFLKGFMLLHKLLSKRNTKQIKNNIS